MCYVMQAEEGIRFPGAGVTNGCKLPNGNKTWVPCKKTADPSLRSQEVVNLTAGVFFKL